MDVDDEEKKHGLFYYVAWGIAAVFLLWLNYDYLYGRVSSNSTVINNFIPPYNPLGKYQLPASSIRFSAENLMDQTDRGYYPGSGYKKQNKLPRILVVPPVEAKESAFVTARAYWGIQKYKRFFDRIVLLAPLCSSKGDEVFLTSRKEFQNSFGTLYFAAGEAQALAHGKWKFKEDEFDKDAYWKKQLPFLQKLLNGIPVLPILYTNVAADDLKQKLLPYLGDERTLVVVLADVSAHYNHREDVCGGNGLEAILDFAKEKRLSAKLLQASESPFLRQEIKEKLHYEDWISDVQDVEYEEIQSVLDLEVQSLKLFAETHGQNVLKLLDYALNEWILHKQKYRVKREDFDEKIFDKGAVFVSFYDVNGVLLTENGSLLPRRAVALDVVEHVAEACETLEKGKRDISQVRAKISFLTGFERIRFKTEDELLHKMKAGVDGLVLRDGNRQGVLLPSAWRQYPDKKDFLHQLKLKAGMSPSYWSGKMKAYRFRTVEIAKDEN